MKQVLMQKGDIILEEVPAPALGANEVLVSTRYSLVSTGTELTGLTSSKQSLITRAIKQPHNVKKALKMASEKGFIKTYKIIKGLLDFGTPTGYSLAGEVVAVGENIRDLAVGDLVACGGAGVANHAEVVAVPRLLVAKIPENVDLREAASVTIGAIAMQGVRQANVKVGETVAVIGLGLIGQLTCQILTASGCRVIGIDPDESRTELAKKLGAHFVFNTADAKAVELRTDGFGADATIITAATESNEPIRSAMAITRKKGTVVVVGAVGLQLDRSPWYEKEIDLKISCSYGPGRYDPSYEDEMLDYPLPYVRWTENRNMDSYLQLIAEGKVKFLALKPEECAFEDAPAAYETLKEKRPLAMLLEYNVVTLSSPGRDGKVTMRPQKITTGKIRLGVIGAGAFTATTHLPHIEKLKHEFELVAIASKRGTTAKQFAKRFEAEYCTTDADEVLNDESIQAVLIATRHDLHAPLVLKALRAGKAVFVEKPLAVNEEELAEIKAFFETEKNPSVLMVGFNRRFSPHAVRIKQLTKDRQNPLLVHYRVNAGFLPLDHWTQRPEQGGRIIGEACHFFDLFEYWTGAQVSHVSAQSFHPRTKNVINQDNFFATITYTDGSVCNLLYTGQGNKELPKEYAEIYCDGTVLKLDDYKSLTVYSSGGRGKGISGVTQDKGHLAELEAFAASVKTGEMPISLEEMFSVTETSFEVGRKIGGDGR